MVNLSRIALLGTRRAGALPDLGPFAVGDSPERQLLVAAGAAAVQDEAGRLAGTAEPVAAAPDETRRVLSDTAASLLRGRLVERDEGLLIEALRLVDAAGFALPPELLPMVLQERSAALRDALRPVLGERGLWLAAFDEDWAWARAATGEGDAVRDFEEGGPKRREAAFRRLRELDPAAARDRLAAVWAGLSADHRESLVAGFEVGLGPDDEAFLDAATRDRSKRVQQAAALVLAQLPTSGLAARMAERARGLLKVAGARGIWGRLTGASEVHVLLPERFEPSWVEDGLVEQPPRGVGPKAWWARQILARTPCTVLADDPKLLLAGLAKDEGEIWLGLAESAVRFGLSTWAAALFDGLGHDADPDVRVGLLGALDPAEVEARVLKLVAAGDPALDRAIRVVPAPWSPRFAERWLAVTRAYATQVAAHPDRHSVVRLRTVKPAARAFPAELFDEALTWTLSVDNPHYLVRQWATEIDAFTDVLRFRRALAAELSLESP